MIIGWNVATFVPGLLGPIDEVRISYLNRLYTYPTTGPLVKDVYTQCLYEFDFTPPVNTGQAPVYTVTVTSPAAGADWTYTLPAPARLVGVDAELLTSAVVANRTPFLEWGPGATTPQVGNPTPIVAGQTSFVHFATGYIDSNYSSGGITIQKTGTPSLLLPAGTIIKSSTIGLQVTDAWTNIALTFSAE
jgi:hypothetical protein